jgi:hypothetical protein
MSSLRFTKQLLDTGKYRVTCTVISETFPAAVFLYSVTPDGNRGEYSGVVNRDELSSRREWTEQITTSVFGLAYVRYTELVQEVADSASADSLIEHTVRRINSLHAELQSATVPETINVPIGE